MSSNGWSGFMKKSQKQQLKTKSKPRSSTTRKRKLNPNLNNISNSSQPTPKKRKLSNIQHVECPMCDKKLLSNLINFHIEEHFIKSNRNNDNNNNNNNNSVSCNNSETTTPPQSPVKLAPNIDKNKEETDVKPLEPKICPLFTSGALPASMFKKSKKKTSILPSQEAIFYVGIITDNNDQYITSWNAEWINKPCEINKFLCKSQEMDYFITNVMIKEPNTMGPTKVYLISNYESNKDGAMTLISNDFKFNYPSPNNYRFSPSLTKSLLQKCVRVSFDSSAVKAAYLLILKDSLQSLLRRLSIIVIEDVILMKEYILLIWILLSESKSDQNEKYHPKICWYNFIFSLVKKCGQYKIRDYMDFSFHPKQEQYINLFTPLQCDENEDIDIDLNDDDDDDNKTKQLLIRSILIRASYGGMKCDVAMLRSFACIWHNRFFGKNKYCKFYEHRLAKLSIPHEIESILLSNNDRSEIEDILDNNNWLLFITKCSNLYNKSSHINMSDILPICDNDLILSAVDFHCSNMLSVLCGNNGNGQCYKQIMNYLDSNSSQIYNNNINNKWRNNVEGLLKFIIWEFRSSQTDKIALLMNEEKPIELFKLYQNIKPIINDYSKSHFKSRKIV